jgi:hypothetical protein
MRQRAGDRRRCVVGAHSLLWHVDNLASGVTSPGREGLGLGIAPGASETGRIWSRRAATGKTTKRARAAPPCPERRSALQLCLADDEARLHTTSRVRDYPRILWSEVPMGLVDTGVDGISRPPEMAPLLVLRQPRRVVARHQRF